MKQNVFPKSDFFLFEANSNYKDILEQSNFKFFNRVLSNPERKTVKFYNGTDTGDSYYKETTKWYDTKSFVEVECTTLDQLVKENNLPFPDFIKIDTQGSEIDILTGSASILPHVKLVYTECPIINYNQGSPNITEYLNFFKKNNFVPVGIFEMHRLENILVQIDIMFVRIDIKNQFLGKTKNIRPFVDC